MRISSRKTRSDLALQFVRYKCFILPNDLMVPSIASESFLYHTAHAFSFAVNRMNTIGVSAEDTRCDPLTRLTVPQV
jgi:hypothetical protein